MKILMYLAALSIATPWSAYALTVLWKWFAVPMGAPVVGVGNAIGLMFIVNYVRMSKVVYEKEQKIDYAATMKMLFLAPALSLLFGWMWRLVILNF